MPTPIRLRTLLLLAIVLALICLAPPASSASDPVPVKVSPALHPAAETFFVPSLDELPAVQPPSEWYTRAGARKGLSGKADTNAELFIAPDTAVLMRGLAGAWPSLLSGFQEAAVLVQPRDVAGLSSSKQLLIIPSGALANTGTSDFFKAALAAYAAEGGTIFCMTQRKGSDLSLLPLPEGQHLEAAGWAEDGGPLFRASAAIGTHPLLKDLTRPTPQVETDGYIRTWPESAEILLVRPDGYPTLIVYPFGKGRVVVSMLFTDLALLLGAPEQDEKLLFRTLLSWSQAGEDRTSGPASPNVRPTRPGKPASTPLAAPAGRLRSVYASITRKADIARVEIALPGSAKLKDMEVLVRTTGQERSTALSREKTILSFDVAVTDSQHRLSYAVYGKDGRSLARGSLVIPDKDSKAVPERPFSWPADPATIKFNDIGKGQVTIEALGFMIDDIISDKGKITIDVPHDLPAASYPVRWLFEDIHGEKNGEASLPLDIGGYQVAVEEVAVRTHKEQAAMTGRATVTINAGMKVSGQLHLQLTGPDNSTVTVSEPVLSLVQGIQAIPVSFSFPSDTEGMWELSYRFSTVLPPGAGLARAPVTLDQGSVLFDTGDSAVLSIVQQPLLQYEPGPLQITSVVVSKGSATVTVALDGRETVQERKLHAGAEHVRFSLARLSPGTHTVRVSLAGSQGKAFRDQRVVSSLLLPDVSVGLQTGRPELGDGNPVIPVRIELENQGKNTSSPIRVVLYDGDPARRGTSISSLEVPALEPKGRASRTIAWPLFRKAGNHTLVAIVDPDHTVEDGDRDNSRASIHVTVPDMLLIASTPGAGFSAVDRVSLPLFGFNLTNDRVQGLRLTTQFTGPGGKLLSSEVVPIPEIVPAVRLSLEQTLKATAPPVGAYLFTASLSSASGSAAADVRFSVLPTLQFTGTLEGTPAAAIQCGPLWIKTGIKSTGNIPHSAGTGRLDVFGPGDDKPVLTRTFPFANGDRTTKIDSLDLPVGTFKLRFSGSVRNDQFKLAKEITLAERALTVSGPIEAKRIESALPRVLVLRGREGRVVEQAVGETMLQHAFDQDDFFLKMVETVEEFMAQAMTGKFNTYILFEPQDIPEAGWLKEHVAGGDGVVVIGSGTAARRAGEGLGFTFREAPARKSAQTIAFTDRSPLGLTGTIPVSGKSMQVFGPNARTAAHFASGDQPAIVVDQFGKGKIAVLPLSLSRSAYEDGTLAVLSLVVRKAALYAAPESETGGILSGGLMITAPGRAVKARVTEALPPGARVLWSNLGSSVTGTTITYSVKADREQRKLLYLYQATGEGPKTGSAEIFHECGGKFVSQGKVQ